MEPASAAEAIESRAAVIEAAREPEPRREPQAPVPPPAPVHQAAPMPVPVAFHAVSEHDAVPDEDTHRPNRKRRHGGGSESGEASLQLVETQAVAPTPVAEDEAPRRTKPRRRRESSVANEPLQIVETHGSSEPAPTDSQVP